MMLHNQNKNGFALLIALVVVSVVISVGLVILDLTLKQLRLSTNSKESETAFHAANAGLECARYWRNESSSSVEAGADITPTCFGTSAMNETRSTVESGVFSYRFESTWGSGLATRCSDMTVLVIVSPIGSSRTVNSSTIEGIIPGYPEGNKNCPAGGICTILSSKGYSRACTAKNLAGTVQREVLLEL